MGVGGRVKIRVICVVLANGALELGLGLGFGLDVAGRRHERGLGARGQQRLDAAERTALVLELGFG